MDKQLVRTSKKISFVLRHHPERIGLALDPYGRVNLSEFLQKYNHHYQTPIDKETIEEIAQKSDKQRFAIEGNTIRALYGHSIPVKPLAPATMPPEILYHGTSRVAAELIKAEGLKKMDRTFVHLSAYPPSALKVGRRHDPKPTILKIAAQKAAETGMLFYPTKSGIWLVDYVPAKFIEKYH